MSLKVNDKVWRKLKSRLAMLGRKDASVKVGVLEGSGEHDGGFSMVELAAVHEFGSPANNIPSRSFIRATFVNNREEAARVLQRLAKGIVTNKLEVDQALGVLGLWGANAVKRYITSGKVVPPLKPATIARKGSSKPLVDTGQLVNSITWKVVA